jgi:hypothetical protein
MKLQKLQAAFFFVAILTMLCQKNCSNQYKCCKADKQLGWCLLPTSKGLTMPLGQAHTLNPQEALVQE